MIDINSIMSIIALNINGLNAEIKRICQIVSENMIPLYPVKKHILNIKIHLD